MIRIPSIKIIAWFTACFLACPLALAVAQESAPDRIVSGNTDSLATPADQALGDTLWFDADSGEVVPVKLRPTVDDSLNRESRWLPNAKRIRQLPKSSTAQGGGGWGTGIFGSGLTIGNLIGWMLLAVALTLAICLLAYLFSKTEIDLGGGRERRRFDREISAPDVQTVQRMKHLPAELRRTDVNLRSEAERLMGIGRFDQAIILLFGHQLLLLDGAHLLRLNRGKTNGTYVRETRSADVTAGARLRATIAAFERSYFGRYAIGQQEFSELWRSNLELEQSIGQHGEAVA